MSDVEATCLSSNRHHEDLSVSQQNPPAPTYFAQAIKKPDDFTWSQDYKHSSSFCGFVPNMQVILVFS